MNWDAFLGSYAHAYRPLSQRQILICQSVSLSVACVASVPVRQKGCFPLCQRLRKFRSEFKWKGPFRFLPTGIFGITSGGGPLISVGIFRPKFAVPFLTNRFFALIREFGKGIESSKSHSYWLARFNRKMSFHFRSVFPLISDRSVWHNGSTQELRKYFPQTGRAEVEARD